MNRTFWIAESSDGFVFDILSFEQEGYREVSVELPLPQNILAGYYKLINGEFVADDAKKLEYEEANKRQTSEEIEAIKSEIQELRAQIEELRNM